MGVWSLSAAYDARPTSPNIVIDSLVLNLDAGNTASYPGTGTTWTNLGTAGSGANATLINSPTFSTSGGGSIVFNGSNQYANVAVTKTANCTFSCWASTTAALTQPMMFIAGPNGSGPDLLFYAGYVAWNTWDGVNANFGTIPATANNGSWHHWVIVTDTVANNTKLYYDGSLYGSTTYKSAAATTELRIGGTTDTYMWTGNIAIFTVNNIALTAAQVSQNFTALRGRFGV